MGYLTKKATEIGIHKLEKMKRSNEASVLIKRQVLDYFKLIDSYQSDLKVFLHKCNVCNNKCCENACDVYKQMYHTFFYPKLIGPNK